MRLLEAGLKYLHDKNILDLVHNQHHKDIFDLMMKIKKSEKPAITGN